MLLKERGGLAGGHRMRLWGFLIAIAAYAFISLDYYLTTSSITEKSGKYDYLEAQTPAGQGFSPPIESESAAIAAARTACRSRTESYGSEAVRTLVNPLRAHEEGDTWVVEPADDSKTFLAALPASGQGMPLCDFRPHWDTAAPFGSDEPGARFHKRQYTFPN
jgi:hypothetical protein